MIFKTKNIIILILFLLFGCENSKENLSNIINQSDSIIVDFNANLTFENDVYTLTLNIENIDSVTYYLSLSDFLIDYSIETGVTLTEPVNTYSMNTVYLIENGYRISGLSAITRHFNLNYIPMYQELNTNVPCEIQIEFNIVRAKRNDSIVFIRRFNPDIIYQSIANLTILDEDQFESFYKELGFWDRKSEFVFDSSYVNVSDKDNERVMKIPGQYSEIAIDSVDSYWINLLHNKKVTLIDTLGKMY